MVVIYQGTLHKPTTIQILKNEFRLTSARRYDCLFRSGDLCCLHETLEKKKNIRESFGLEDCAIELATTKYDRNYNPFFFFFFKF